MIINVKRPILTNYIYDELNLVGSINFNFSFSLPLSYISDKSLFGILPVNYLSQGFQHSSFAYNVQSQFIVYILLFLISKISNHMLKKCSTKSGKMWNFISKILNMFIFAVLVKLCGNNNCLIVEIFYYLNGNKI